MADFFLNLSPIMQALFASIFTWFVTLLGASVVFFFKDVNKKVMDSLLGFSGGVMVAASFWSLLNPAIEMANSLGLNSWIVVSSGFLCGAFVIFIGDKIYDYIYKNKQSSNKFKRSFMLISSITLHNIPEGLVVGVAFGSLAHGIPGTGIVQAITLALGIGLQNFPEGSAVSLPLKRDGYSCRKALFYGQLSGMVEPVAAVIGALLVLKIRILLPFLLAVAAGAMIYVVVSELIPESQHNENNKGIVSIVTIIGFMIMMILDVALG